MKKRSFVAILLCLCAVISINACDGQMQSASRTSNNDRFESTLNIQAVTYDSKGYNEPTNVSVKKYARSENENLRFYYDITTPRVDDYLFVLALDSSGSFAYNAGSEPSRQAEAVIGAVPEFIQETKEKHSNKNFNLSIVSWDDDIDFAYTKGDFTNKNPDKVRLVPIKDVIYDIKTLSPFQEPDKEGVPYRCEEKDHTDLSQPINASLRILNSKENQPSDSHRVRKFIIIVTGEGETARCDPQLIDAARGIPIYVVGMEFKDYTDLMKHIQYDLCSNPSDFLSVPPTSSDLKGKLLETLNAALGKALSDPVASNVSIIEPIDSCFNPSENAILTIKGNSIKEVPITGIRNGTQIEYRFPEGLLPENITELSFDVSLLLNFPYSKIDAFDPSALKYTWFNGKEFNISIPKNKISLTTQPLNQNTTDLPSGGEDRKSNPPEQETRQTDGFGAIQLAASVALFKLANILKR